MDFANPDLAGLGFYFWEPLFLFWFEMMPPKPITETLHFAKQNKSNEPPQV